MKKLNFKKITYLGADIVKELVLKNIKKHKKENIHFFQLDLIKDDLPNVDLIICRDCLVHFSYRDIFLALKNLDHSGSKYLLSTTFPEQKNNYDIYTGEWRALNLTLPPFNLPKPIKLIKEGCTESKGAYKDKSLGLWKIKDIIKQIKL